MALSEEAARQQLGSDLSFYARNCLHIRSKSGKVVPFKFNKAQIHIHEQLELQKQLTAAQITGISQAAQSQLMKAQTDLTDRMFDNNMDVQKFEHEQIVDLEKLNIDRKKVAGE